MSYITEPRLQTQITFVCHGRDNVTHAARQEARQISAVPVEEVMTLNPVTCHADDDLQHAIDAMEKHQVRRIPVVDDDNRIIGIIAQADIATRTNEPQTTAEVVEEISKSAAA